MNGVVFVVIFVAVFVVAYLVFRKIHPQAGTLGANLSGIGVIGLSYLSDLFGQLSQIPFSTLLDDAHAKLTLLAVFLGNAIIRTLHRDQTPPAPPAA